MANKEIPWGNGGNITVSAPEFTGTQTLKISSTQNSSPVRSQSILLYSVSDPSKRITINVNQAAGVRVYELPVFLDFHYDVRDAAGGTLTPYLSVEQTWTYNGVAGTGETLQYTSQSPIIGPTFEYEIITAASGLTLDSSTGIVTWAANTGGARSGVIRCTVTWNGVTSNADVSVSQNADAISSYSDITINSFTVPDIPAAGGTISSGTYTATQTVNYVSGKTTPITSGFHASYSSEVSAGSKGTSVSGRTNAGTLTLTLDLNGKTASKAATVYQQANEMAPTGIILETFQPSPDWIGADTPGNLPASQCFVGFRYYTTYGYTSGSTGASEYSPIISESTGLRIVSDPQSMAHYHINGGISVDPRGTTEGAARSCTINAVVAEFTSNTITLTQVANVATYGEVSISGGAVSDIPASGGTRSGSNVTGVSYGQTVSFTSGAIRAGSCSASWSSGVSVGSLGTTEKSRTHVGTLTVTVTGEGGKSNSHQVYVYQAANTKTTSGPNSYKFDKYTAARAGDTLTLVGYYTATYTSGATATIEFTPGNYDTGVAWITYDPTIVIIGGEGSGYRVAENTTKSFDSRSALLSAKVGGGLFTQEGYKRLQVREDSITDTACEIHNRYTLELPSVDYLKKYTGSSSFNYFIVFVYGYDEDNDNNYQTYTLSFINSLTFDLDVENLPGCSINYPNTQLGASSAAVDFKVIVGDYAIDKSEYPHLPMLNG